jgi:DNA-binding GntR family transcriptional regulator
VEREIRHNSPVPVYVQLADLIAGQIESGDLQPDYPIPSEAQLKQEFGVARNTARRAVELLRERGLVYTIGGRGTFVAKRTA